MLNLVIKSNYFETDVLSESAAPVAQIVFHIIIGY